MNLGRWSPMRHHWAENSRTTPCVSCSAPTNPVTHHPSSVLQTFEFVPPAAFSGDVAQDVDIGTARPRQRRTTVRLTAGQCCAHGPAIHRPRHLREALTDSAASAPSRCAGSEPTSGACPRSPRAPTLRPGRAPAGCMPRRMSGRAPPASPSPRSHGRRSSPRRPPRRPLGGLRPRHPSARLPWSSCPRR
jgi:hypothetical protein